MSTRNKLFFVLALCVLSLIFVPGLPETCADIIFDGAAYLGQKVQVQFK